MFDKYECLTCYATKCNHVEHIHSTNIDVIIQNIIKEHIYTASNKYVLTQNIVIQQI